MVKNYFFKVHKVENKGIGGQKSQKLVNVVCEPLKEMKNICYDVFLLSFKFVTYIMFCFQEWTEIV